MKNKKINHSDVRVHQTVKQKSNKNPLPPVEQILILHNNYLNVNSLL